MDLQTETSVLLPDVFQFSVDRDVEDLVGVKALEALNLTDHIEVEVPHEPEGSEAAESEHEGQIPDCRFGLFTFLCQESLELGRLRIDALILQIIHAFNHFLERIVGERQQNEGQDGEREIVECRVVVLEHIFFAVAFEVVLEA